VHLYCDILFRSIISHVCCLILVKYQYFEDVLPIQRKQSGLNYKQAKPKPVGTAHMYNVSQEVSHYTLAVALSNDDRFSQIFHQQTQ